MSDKFKYYLKVATMLDLFIYVLLTHVNLIDKKPTATVQRLMSTPRFAVSSESGSIILYDRILRR